MLVRIADDLAHAGQDCNFFRRSLRVAASDHDLSRGVLAMNAANGGAGVLVGCGGYGAGVKNYKLRFRSFTGTFQAALPQLAFESGTVRLRGPAAEIHHVESCHVSILTQDQRRMLRRIDAGTRNRARAAGTSPRADEIRLAIGKREEGELGRRLCNRLQLLVHIKPRLLASSAGNTPGRIPDAPGLA